MVPHSLGMKKHIRTARQQAPKPIIAGPQTADDPRYVEEVEQRRGQEQDAGGQAQGKDQPEDARERTQLLGRPGVEGFPQIWIQMQILGPGQP